MFLYWIGVQLWKRFCDVERNPTCERCPSSNVDNGRGGENQGRFGQEARDEKFQGGRRPLYEGIVGLQVQVQVYKEITLGVGMSVEVSDILYSLLLVCNLVMFPNSLHKRVGEPD